MAGNWLQIPRNGNPIPKNYHEKVRETLAKIEEPESVLQGCAQLEAAIAGFSKLGLDTKELGKSLAWAELRLGELLGPPPGKGPGRGKRSRMSDLLEKQRIEEFRRMAYPKVHRNLVSERIRKGQWSRRARLKAIDDYKAKRKAKTKTLDIRKGDFREVLSDVKESSVDLILTDPPYADVEMYDELARFAMHVLKSGGSCLAYSGQHNLPAILEVMIDSGLRYWWIIAVRHRSGTQSLQGKKLTCAWKPILWFVKETRTKDANYVRDMIEGSAPDKTAFAEMDAADRRNAEWAQGEDEVVPLIRDLTNHGELIVDPFAGTGSIGRAAIKLGRRFIGAEIRD